MKNIIKNKYGAFAEDKKVKRFANLKANGHE
jgi:hypothetical protein